MFTWWFVGCKELQSYGNNFKANLRYSKFYHLGSIKLRCLTNNLCFTLEFVAFVELTFIDSSIAEIISSESGFVHFLIFFFVSLYELEVFNWCRPAAINGTTFLLVFYCINWVYIFPVDVSRGLQIYFFDKIVLGLTYSVWLYLQLIRFNLIFIALFINWVVVLLIHVRIIRLKTIILIHRRQSFYIVLGVPLNWLIIIMTDSL